MKKETKQFLSDRYVEKWIKNNPQKIEKIRKKIFDYMIFGKPILLKKIWKRKNK